MERGRRGQHPDLARVGLLGGGLDRGFHPHERNFREDRAQVLERGGRGGVAGDDNQLGALGEQQARDRFGDGAQFFQRAAAVGHLGLVPEVEQVLVGQGGTDRAQDGKPAHAGVVKRDGLGWGRAGHAGNCSMSPKYVLIFDFCCFGSSIINLPFAAESSENPTEE